jgi:hypothetical protein
MLLLWQRLEPRILVRSPRKQTLAGAWMLEMERLAWDHEPV